MVVLDIQTQINQLYFFWDWDKVDEPVIIKQDEFNTDKQGVDNFYSQTPADFPFKQTLPKSKFDKIQAPLYTNKV